MDSFHIYPSFHQSIEVRVGFENVAIHPRFRCGAAPCVVDHANRHAGGLMQLSRKEITYGRKFTDGFWSANFPFTIVVCPNRFLSTDLRKVDHSDIGIIGRQSFQIRIGRLIDIPLHVGLARANPDFSDQDIVDFDHAGALYSQLQCIATHLHRGKLRGPCSLFIGSGFYALTTDGDCDFLTGIVGAPNLVLLALLKHHVV